MKISNVFSILSLVAPAAVMAAPERKRVRKVYTPDQVKRAAGRALQPGVEQVKAEAPVEAISVSLSLSASLSMSIVAEVVEPAGPGVVEEVPVVVEEVAHASMSMSMSMAADEGLGTIYDLGVANPDFTMLVTLVEAAGLSDVFKGEGPFTLFAPTNDAFDALIASQPEGTLDLLGQPENISILQSLLKYHVLGVEAPSSSLVSGEYETLNGESVTVTVSDSGVMVNDANVIMADIMASNGVIHVIDKVLEAPSLSVSTTSSSAAATSEGVTTTAASSTAAVESGSTTAATESSPTTTAAEASSPTESASTTAAVAEEETVTAEGETAAPSIAVAEVTVSPTATPAAKSGAMSVGTTVAALVASCVVIVFSI